MNDEYYKLSMDELEELAISGDELAAEELVSRMNDEDDANGKMESFEYLPEIEDNDLKRMAVDNEIDAGDTLTTDIFDFDDEGLFSSILDPSNTNSDEGRENCTDVADDIAVVSDYYKKLSEMRRMPIIALKKKVDSGEPLALIAFGEKMCALGSDVEAPKGIDMLDEGVNKMQDEFYKGLIPASFFSQLLSSASKTIIDYDLKDGHIDPDYGRLAFQYATNAFELNNDNRIQLIRCYEKGIGCDINVKKVEALSIGVNYSNYCYEKQNSSENAAESDTIDRNSCEVYLDDFFEKASISQTIGAACAAHGALGAFDIDSNPIIKYALNVWLSENGLTDQKGLYTDIKELRRQTILLKRYKRTIKDVQVIKRLSVLISDNKIRAGLLELGYAMAEDKDKASIKKQLYEAKNHAKEIKQPVKTVFIDEDFGNLVSELCIYLKGKPYGNSSIDEIFTDAEKGDFCASIIKGYCYIQSRSIFERTEGLKIIENGLNEFENDGYSKRLSDIKQKVFSLAGNLFELSSRYSADERINKETFTNYQKAFETNSDCSANLIRCYELGVGTKKEPTKAAVIKESYWDTSDIICCTSIFIDYVEGDMITMAAMCAQQALSCTNCSAHPKLAARLKMWLAENNYTDAQGETIDYKKANREYRSLPFDIDYKEAACIFSLSDDEKEKTKCASTARNAARDYWSEGMQEYLRLISHEKKEKSIQRTRDTKAAIKNNALLICISIIIIAVIIIAAVNPEVAFFLGEFIQEILPWILIGGVCIACFFFSTFS